MASDEDGIEVYQLHILLLGISPAIWRRVLVRSDIAVDDLHATIQIAMGWSNECLHCFRIHGCRYGQDRIGGPTFHGDIRRPLSTFGFQVGERFTYEYDFISAWRHQVRVEKILPLDRQRHYPFCAAGRRLAPPEDSGEPWRFLERQSHYTVFDFAVCLQDLLKATPETVDEIRQRMAEILKWAGRDRFDRKAASRRLQAYGRGEDIPADLLGGDGACADPDHPRGRPGDRPGGR